MANFNRSLKSDILEQMHLDRSYRQGRTVEIVLEKEAQNIFIEEIKSQIMAR